VLGLPDFQYFTMGLNLRKRGDRHMTKLFVAVWMLMSAMLGVAQGKTSGAGVPVQMVVTVRALHGKDMPVLFREDVIVRQGKVRVPTTEWIPLVGDHASAELFLLVDDSAGSSFGTHLQELRHFIGAQPATSAIGVGYMRNGTVMIAQNLTKDHAQAAKALRLPLGNAGGGGSPYLSLSDLIKRWPASPTRHEVLMMTDGIDRLGGARPNNPYVESAIESAQRAGIVVYSIYTAGIGQPGHRFWRINWGQNNLAEISEKTGGEAYFLGTGEPVSFEPYLKDLGERLTNQYMLTFLAKPGNKAGLQSVKLTTEVPNAELVAPRSVFVPAGS